MFSDRSTIEASYSALSAQPFYCLVKVALTVAASVNPLPLSSSLLLLPFSFALPFDC